MHSTSANQKSQAHSQADHELHGLGLLTDAKGRVVSAAPELLSLLGWLPEEIAGKPWHRVLRSSFAPGEAALAKAVSPGLASSEVGDVVDATRAKRIIRRRIRPLHDEAGSLTGYALEIDVLGREPEHASPGSPETFRLRFGLVGVSELSRALFAQTAAMAARREHVLIFGETGVGKASLAEAMHGLSDRRAEPFIRLTGAAYPPAQLERELFGEVTNGQFKPGLFARAAGGTAYLADAADMPELIKDKLASALDSGFYQPLGTEKPKVLRARIILGTTSDPDHLAEADAASGRLVAALPLRLPIAALRERPEDILPLAEYFLALLASLGRDVPKGFAPAVRKLFSELLFAGNVRELKNIVEYAAMLAPSGEPIALAHLPPSLAAATKGGGA